MNGPWVKYSYGSRTLFVSVEAGPEAEPVFTLARPMWSSDAFWACQPVGKEPFGSSESFPTATVSRLLDDHVGVLASEVMAHKLEKKTLHAVAELLKEFGLIRGELAVDTANRLCSAYNGRLDAHG